jgi:hypothetical protein
MKTILKIPSRSQICSIESCISTTVLVRQYRFVNDDTVQKCILRLSSCLAVSGFTTVVLPSHLYVYAREQYQVLLCC